jgi:hypothetical protein
VFNVVDCWVTDSNGNVHKGYNNCPVPVSPSVLGAVVGKLEYEKNIKLHNPLYVILNKKTR